ncbi:MAG: hypothetical protein ACLU6E_02375 [Dysosmobacter welbionis]|uniref:hypothetical protein n=1 Tax=Dysosmobacter welbionis TaxID=2093857 RepID=UPI003999C5E1
MGRKTFKKSIDFVRASSHKIQSDYNASASRTLHLTALSGLGNILMGLFKIASGVLAFSIFTCVNGCYTLGMVLARYCALAGVVRTKDISRQYRYYRWSGIILIVASCLYIAYSIRMYFHPTYTTYHPYIAMGIATVTFVEIGLNLRGVLVFRKNRSPLLHALKTINLATSLISLVLTQAAILSFADEVQNPASNGILGALMGGCAVLLGVYMLLRMRRITNTADCRREQKALNRMMKKHFPNYALTAVEKGFTEQGQEIVSVYFLTGIEPEVWEQICGEAERRCRLQLRDIEG